MPETCQYKRMPYLSSVLTDTFPEGLEDGVEGLYAVRCGGLSQRCESEGRDGANLLLLVNQSWGTQWRGIVTWV